MATSRFGLGGHGMFLAPASPCSIFHRDDGSLLVSIPGRGAVEIVPGVEPATDAVHQSVADGQTTIHFGPQGPAICCPSGLDLAEVLLKVDVGLPASPWMLLGPGTWMQFPTGLTLLSGEAPYFELHLDADPSKNTFVSFEPRDADPSEIVMTPGPGQRADRTGIEEGPFGPIRWFQFAYEFDGLPWLQRFYLLPYGEGATMALRAQAPAAIAEKLFELAEVVAVTFEPLDD